MLPYISKEIADKCAEKRQEYFCKFQRTCFEIQFSDPRLRVRRSSATDS